MNEAIDAVKGSCAHHFKTYRDGRTICSDAPPKVLGPFGDFKGCGKSLRDDEL